MEMPKPTDAHKKLERLNGKWKGEEKMFPSPWDPKGGTAMARIHNRSAIEGFNIVQDYEQERDGVVNFRGHGVFSYDANQQCYILHWWDSMGMPPNEFKGNLADNILTLTSKGMMGMNRATFDFRQDGKYTFTLDVSQDGKQWMAMMEGKYQRE